MTFSIMALSMTTFSIMGSVATLSITVSSGVALNITFFNVMVSVSVPSIHSAAAYALAIFR